MQMLKAEWKKIFSRPMTIITIVGLLFVPFFYGLIFLSAYWDPYGNTDQLPVAVVNQDEGADYHGSHLEIGKNFVDNLQDNTTFKWTFTDKETALKGLEKENYYLVIEIPASFSRDAATVMDKQPKKMQLNYFTNPGKNYPGSQISATAMVKINEQIDAEVTKEYTRSLFDSLKDVSSSFHKASDAAGKIDDGSQKVENGSKELSNKLKELAASTITFNKGVADVAGGAGKLQNGLQDAKSGSVKLQDGLKGLENGTKSLQQGAANLQGGLGELATASGQLHAGAKELNGGLAELNTGLQSSSAGSDKLNEQMAAYNTKLHELNTAMKNAAEKDSPDPAELKKLSAALGELEQSGKQLQGAAGKLAEGQKQLAAGAQRLSEGSGKLEDNLGKLGAGIGNAKAGAGQLASGSDALQAGAVQLVQGGGNLSAGLDKLVEGQHSLIDGMDKLEHASGKLQSGSRQLADGSASLHTGAKSLADGTGKLHSALQDGAGQTGVHADEGNYDMFASPTELVGHKLHEIASYGVGLAPYILCIALYAGTMMFASAYSLKEAAIRPQRGLAWFASKLSVIVFVSLLSSILADSIVIWGVGLEVQSTWLFYLFTFITSMAFFSIIFFLYAALNNVGLYAAFLLLLLQIGGSGGTFPSLLTPDFFQAIHPYLPMTYAINGFRQIISIGTDYSLVWEQAGILLGYIAAFLLLAAVVFILRTRHIARTGHWEHVSIVDENRAGMVQKEAADQ
ncbi:YhgE/Pip family protein [Paenibacillus pinihumi]|uniref:YhgE/Pip family protein n=1 Tax=Paenibacillus pinihumi TaxID=669462 RepID=UPI0004116894|nr:YhgE/Pip domain-containing protein [Paenibacillus pinihumi]